MTGQLHRVGKCGSHKKGEGGLKCHQRFDAEYYLCANSKGGNKNCKKGSKRLGSKKRRSLQKKKQQKKKSVSRKRVSRKKKASKKTKKSSGRGRRGRKRSSCKKLKYGSCKFRSSGGHKWKTRFSPRDCHWKDGSCHTKSSPGRAKKHYRVSAW